MDFKEKVAEIFTSIETELSMDDALQLIEIPPSSDMGDYAVPCFKFAKKYRKSPAAIANEIVCTKSLLKSKLLNTGYINLATAGSPIQPRPNDAKVIPNCDTDKYESKLCTKFDANLAFEVPSCTNESMRELLTFTIANSAATKKPFNNTKNITKNKLSIILEYSNNFLFTHFHEQ